MSHGYRPEPVCRTADPKADPARATAALPR